MPEGVAAFIIKRAQAGDKVALTELYEHYKPEVYRYLYYRLGNPGLAEDLTSEVFMRVIENLPRYRQRQVPFQAWLFRITRNLVIDYFRKMNVRDHVDLNQNIASDHEGPEMATERSLTEEQLQQALQRLTADQFDVIVLRFIADMPIKQVAAALDKSESAVKTLQARGLGALQRILSQRKVFHG